ncbi:hypothetical protein BJY04DRAFT_217893 [Aspergillus karnatakaensis]|uniref:cupin domain-containing protein n=1 Tax=Aspergillus karnatakaensis TaxID=1810916 RepID=UPI003CCDBB33
MTTQIIPYTIKPTPLIPNSPKPLLLYKNTFLDPTDKSKVSILNAYDTFTSHGWTPRWITTYGRTQVSHYHPQTHEVMIVLSGPGTIRFGTADLAADPEKHTYGKPGVDFEDGSTWIDVEAGDLFVIPAGVTHKSYDVREKRQDPTCLSGGGAHRIEAADPREFVRGLQVGGFTMMGAYPGDATWGWAEGGEHIRRFEDVWRVRNPDLDPVFGAERGVNEFWKGREGKL